jgi:hypothetical protein
MSKGICMLFDINPTALAGSSISELIAVAGRLLAERVDQPEVGADGADPQRLALALLEKVLVTELVRMVRQGGIDDLHEAALLISELANTQAGEELARIDPDGRGAWLGYGDVLAEAARRRDRGSLGPVLSAGNGKAGQIVNLVAKAQSDGRQVSRKQMLEFLSIDQGQLTRLLIALEDSDVIHRTKAKGEKEVWLSPGPAFVDAVSHRRTEQPVATKLQTRYAPHVPPVNASLALVAAKA